MSKRPLAKGKGYQPPGDFYALGGKSDARPVKKALPDRKREAPTPPLGSSLAAKRPKTGPGLVFTPLGRPEAERRGSPAQLTLQPYDEVALDADPSELLSAVLAADEAGDDDRVEGLLCGVVRSLRTNRAKPDSGVYLSLMCVAKTRAQLFDNELVLEAFCSLLKRDVTLNFKSKGNALVSVLVCNVLMSAFVDEDDWPDTFLKVYIDDCLGDRVWVDREDCRPFVDNIARVFGTQHPPKSKLDLKTDLMISSSSPSHSGDEDERSLEAPGGEKPNPLCDLNIPVQSRYNYQLTSVEGYVIDTIKDQLTRRQTMDGGCRNLIRLMTSAAGYAEVRTLATSRLEVWLQNAKLTRPAQDLLHAICLNCSPNQPTDMEVIANLIKLRLKAKPLVQHFTLCVRELLNQHSENLRTILTHVIYNELSNVRNPNNMTLLAVLFQHAPEDAAKILGEIFLDFLCHREDYLRALRTLLREIVRSLRFEINFLLLARALMEERAESKFLCLDPVIKERMLQSVADLVTLVGLLSITPTVKDAVQAFDKGELKDVDVLKQYQVQMSSIHRDSVWWLHTVVPKMYDVSRAQDFTMCLHKVLFMEKPEQYYNKDNWPPESERSLLLRVAAEVPVNQDTLMRVLVMGLSRDLPLNNTDAVDLADLLIRRAASLQIEDFKTLNVDRMELIDVLLNLCTYHHPEGISLPEGYDPPTLAISNLYWKSWTILAVVAAFNPQTFGQAGWENYPILKCLMEMMMTNNFRFPPPTTASDDAVIEEIRAQDRQVGALEKQEILEFEGHLAAATRPNVTITESSSLLLDQLTRMDPRGPARKPPPGVLDQLRAINKSLRIGHLLCSSRQPDFLMDIVQRQGTSASMPWLADLVESCEASLDILPVQCLCEFLLHDTDPDVDNDDDNSAMKFKKKQKQKKQEQLLVRLQLVIHDSTSSVTMISEILDYFLRRLSNTHAHSRVQAVRGLSMVLARPHADSGSDTDMETDEVTESRDQPAIVTSFRWLLKDLPKLPKFEGCRGQVVEALRQACQVETDVDSISAYLLFLSRHGKFQQLQQLADTVLDVSQLIVERSSVMSAVVPASMATWQPRVPLVLSALVSLYTNYLTWAKAPDDEAFAWSDCQDQILLKWEGGVSATLHILVVHAMMIILSCGPPREKDEGYSALLSAWFPRTPTAYLVDTSEEADLLPDWLKLKLIRSSVETLVDAGLRDLEPHQLVLFVQSFGIPVASMSKLLKALDAVVVQTPGLIEQVLVDRHYMAQLVEVQHARGATSGDKFYAALKDRASPESVESDESEGESGSARHQISLAYSQDDSKYRRPGHITAALKRIFLDETLSQADRDQMCKSLQKSVMKSSKLSIAAVECMEQIFSSRDADTFILSMYKHSHLACPLLKILAARQCASSQGRMETIMAWILDRGSDQASPLTKLARQHFSTGTAAKRRSVPGRLKRGKQIDEEKFVHAVSEAADENYSRLEELVNMCMRDGLQSNSNMAASTCRLLQKRQQSRSPQSGLIIDWLELLDPEVLSSCPELEERLLFSRRAVTMETAGEKRPVAMETRSHGNSSAYLLALLTHRTSWTTLHRCIEHLLRPDVLGRGYDYTSVLDFLWACLHIPKIWQGRDKKLPLNYVQEDVLNLSLEQMTSLADCIISEAAQVPNPNQDGNPEKKEGSPENKDGSPSTAEKPHVNPSTSENSDGNSTAAENQNGHHSSQHGSPDELPDASVECIEKRLYLLKKCCCDQRNRITAVLEHLYKKIKEKNNCTSVCQHLLLEMYLQYPYSVYWLDDWATLLAQIQAKQHSSTSKVDAITHRLMLSLAETGPGARVESVICDANIALRKFAMEHPTLLLRQIPMLAALLRGRTHFHANEFRHRNNHTLFSYCLGLLELLVPQIFHKQSAAVVEIVDQYFNVVQAYAFENTNFMASIVPRFLRFLSTYLSQDSTRAVNTLQKHRQLLILLTRQLPDFPTLRALIASVSAHRGQDSQPEPKPAPNTLSSLPARPSSPWSMTQLAPFLKKISKDSCEDDVLEVLEDLDNTSKRKADILDHFLPDLKRLMVDHNDRLRNLAFTLVMRHVRQNPRACGQFVPSFIKCLESENCEIINSALRNLAEFTLLGQEHASRILQKAFSASITTKIDMTSHINEAVQLLNMETMTMV